MAASINAGMLTLGLARLQAPQGSKVYLVRTASAPVPAGLAIAMRDLISTLGMHPASREA